MGQHSLGTTFSGTLETTPPFPWLAQCIRRPVAVGAWAVALLVAGAWALFEVPIEWVPRLELPEVRISAAWPGASPRAVERYVAAPIERALQGVPGTARVESLSQEGVATVIVGVSDEVSLAAYVAGVGEQLALLRTTLPARVVPRLTKEVPEALRDAQGFLTLQLVGPDAPDRLRALAEADLAPRLRSVPGIASVIVAGGTRRELLVTLRPDRLAAYGYGPEAVRQALREAVGDEAYGRLQARGQATLLFKPSENSVESLRRIPLERPGAPSAPVRLQDVADVRLGPAPVRAITRIDGQNAVTLTLDRAPGSHMLRVAGAVRARLADLDDALPAGVRLRVADDRTEAVRAQLRSLAWRGGLGLALVLLVLLFMLKSVRACLVVLFSALVALGCAFLLMRILGLTLNLLTLAGLALVFGLLVDNAVVMVEQLGLQRARYCVPERTDLEWESDAAAAALRSVWLPLAGGTLTTMAVLVPLIYLSGDLRVLFLPFGVLVSVTLGVSLVAAAVLVPTLGRFLPLPEPARPAPRRRQLADVPFYYADRFSRATLWVLALLIGIPLWALPPTLEAPAAGWAPPVARLAHLYNRTIGAEKVRQVRGVLDPALGGVTRLFAQQAHFGPQWNFEARPEVFVRLDFPPGTPIARADSLVGRFERKALASPAVAGTVARITEDYASLRVRFTVGAMGSAAPYAVRETLIGQAVLLAGLDVSVGGLLPEGYYSRSGTGISGIAAEAYGPSYEKLEALCGRFAAKLQRNRRVAAVDLNTGRPGAGFAEARQVLRFRWDAGARLRTGVTAAALADGLRPLLETRFPAFRADLEGEAEMPVRIVAAGADETDVSRLAGQVLPMGDGHAARLQGFADVTTENVPGAIERAAQQYRRLLTIDYRGPARLGTELVQRELDAMPLPPGYRIEMAQPAFFTAQVWGSLLWVLAGTLLLVYLVTAAVFGSWTLPLVVLLSVPVAALGVSLGFLLTEAPFGEGAFIGLVLLVGIAVNDSILLVDRYRALRARHPATAARLAVRDRLRPMWTTTLTSVVAMLPLLAFPDGGDFWTGLAVTVVGGLLASTLLAPPVSIALLARRPGR